jgi:hypothetical protein
MCGKSKSVVVVVGVEKVKVEARKERDSSRTAGQVRLASGKKFTGVNSLEYESPAWDKRCVWTIPKGSTSCEAFPENYGEV